MSADLEAGKRELAERLDFASGTNNALSAASVTAEVTPEMLEAGCTAMAGFNEDFESREDVVERIYLAMREVEKASIRR